MNKRFAAALAAVLVVVLAFAACSGGNPANYKQGTVSGDTFESEWMGLRFECPDTMAMGTDEDMQAVMDAGSEMTGADTSGVEMVYEMIAQSPMGFPSVSITSERLSVNVDEDGYIEISKQQFESVAELGYECGDTVEASLGGVTFKMMPAEADAMGISIYQRMYCMKKDGYMVVVSASALDESELDAIEGCFSAY